jgi:hypothetical protein
VTAEQVLSELERQVIVHEASQFPLVRSLPEHLRRRTSPGQRCEPAPVGWKDGIEDRRLLQEMDTPAAKHLQELGGWVVRVELRTAGRRAGADERHVTDPVAIESANVARDRHRRRHGRDQKRSEIGPRRQQALSDAGTRAKHGRLAASRFERSQDGVGDQLIPPGRGKDEVKTGGANGVRELDRAGG